MIDKELFEAAQQARLRNGSFPNTINKGAQTYSLSGLMRSMKCGSKMRLQMSPKGEPRVYCAGRAGGLGCTCKGTFLNVYEGQVRWYLETFHIPEDYQEILLSANKETHEIYEDSHRRKATLQTRLVSLQEMYEWGHKSKEQYLV